MDISECLFSELSYSKLFNTYLTNFNKLNSFYPYNALAKKDIKKRADNTRQLVDRNELVKSLSSFQEELGIAEDQQQQLDKLSQSNSLTIVTGQQLGVYGGPVFTIYKTLTAISLARTYEKELSRPVIPVFWMADEDHDFDEIAWTGIVGKEDYTKIHLEQAGKGIPVAREQLDKSIEVFKHKIKEELFETDFSDALWNLIDRHYKAGKTHAQAFSGLINELFAKEGVLIAGSNHKEIKGLVSDELAQSISSADDIYDAIEEKSKEIETLFHRQVMNGDSNLFYLDEISRRIKIKREGKSWIADETVWSEKELVELIKTQPECFSPNVFLRPIIQDKLLPTLGYVAGPGELAYYGQMRSLYELFEMEMPPIIPRYTATIIESGISRIIDKLPFKVCEYEQRIEDLESAFIEQSDNVDLEHIFQNWKDEIEKSAEAPLKVINEIDPTLDGTVGKTVAGFENELNKLKGKVYRSIKQQEGTQLKRIEKIKINLFPDGGLQERAVSPVYFMNKYGLNLWQDLLKQMDENGLDLTKHHLIEL